MTWPFVIAREHLLLPESNKRCGCLQTREEGGSFTQNQRDQTLESERRDLGHTFEKGKMFIQ